MREHIDAVEKASADQIKETRYWKDLKRKQQIKSLVREIETNVTLYDDIMQFKAPYNGVAFSFILVAIENCLADTPIDSDEINSGLLNLYYSFKTHDNKITVTRTPGISHESLEVIIRKITEDYTHNQKIIKAMIIKLTQYEEGIVLQPPPY